MARPVRIVGLRPLAGILSPGVIEKVPSTNSPKRYHKGTFYQREPAKPHSCISGSSPLAIGKMMDAGGNLSNGAGGSSSDAPVPKLAYQGM